MIKYKKPDTDYNTALENCKDLVKRVCTVLRAGTPASSNISAKTATASHTARHRQSCSASSTKSTRTHCWKSSQGTSHEVCRSPGKDAQLLNKLIGKAEYELTLWMGTAVT
jgi:hypothetical protein